MTEEQFDKAEFSKDDLIIWKSSTYLIKSIRFDNRTLKIYDEGNKRKVFTVHCSEVIQVK